MSLYEGYEVELQRKPLNSGGYDEFGRYFGTGNPLYLATCQDIANYNDRPETMYFRATNRKSAWDTVFYKWPGAVKIKGTK